MQNVSELNQVTKPKAENQSIPEALQHFDKTPNSAFIRLPIVMRLYGVSAATVWRGVKNGTIPKPVKCSERCTAWNVGLVRAALAAKAV
ncbi:MAG: AlpA family phage regulatory protein [Methylotenera sp.]|nr:AlpA family phage regulatory protein [Methylotenera sp.]